MAKSSVKKPTEKITEYKFDFSIQGSWQPTITAQSGKEAIELAKKQLRIMMNQFFDWQQEDVTAIMVNGRELSTEEFRTD